MSQYKLILEILYYLEYRNVHVENEYEWREINGLILQILETFEIKKEDHEHIQADIFQSMKLDGIEPNQEQLNNLF